MTRVFYTVEPGTAAFAFCEQFAADSKAKKEEFAAYAKSKGARGWTEGFRRSFSGFVFDYDAAIPAGLKKERRSLSDGSEWYTPRLRSVEGKAIVAEMAALGQLPDQSGFAEAFEIPASLKYGVSGVSRGAMRLTAGGFFESSIIAWPKLGDFWVVLPDIDGEIAELQADGNTVEPSSWSLPAGLKRSSKARYELAVAQVKVEEEEE